MLPPPSRPDGTSALRVEASGDPRTPCWRILRKEGAGKLQSGDTVPGLAATCSYPMVMTWY